MPDIKPYTCIYSFILHNNAMICHIFIDCIKYSCKDWFQDSLIDTKIQGCSNPLFKIMYYLRIIFIYSLFLIFRLLIISNAMKCCKNHYTVCVV